jgi:hypothetical protein
MTIIILPSAKEDLAEGFAFFEAKQAGLGTYFLESLFSDIDSLKIYAGVHRRVFGYHRLLSKRFTFAVYYSVQSGTGYVQAVLDCRQDPARLGKRLGEKTEN